MDGKIWILWSDTITIGINERGDQLVHIEVMWVGFTLKFSAVYAKCTKVGRRDLWRAMEEIFEGVEGPWMSAGDFNMISSATERSGGAP